ncbi:WSC domain-containing protein [Stachybotrys elegans]|uniref:WSC domain-containing protein n=1 Tax=Stachybotrys elegans TaxID=80388 RepID=A0A8K0WWC5_9HYPO|nr:WSC domain-containing protein [Stachybotrys elegans]
MGFKKALVAAAALTFVQYTQAWNIELPPCVDPFKPFVYSGCYKDGSPAALEYSAPGGNKNMTIEKCVAECKGNGFRYAGLKYYGNCYCGSTVKSSTLDESLCKLPCDGDKSQTCGGNGALSVYQDPTFSTSVDDVTINNYKPIGCYTDNGAGGRSLSWPQKMDEATFTPGKCLDACRQNGYPFAGLEYGRQCWCGSVLANGTQPVSDTECNMPCLGDSSLTCGGRSRLNIFVAKELESLEPCGYKPPVGTTTTVTTVSATSTSSSVEYPTPSESTTEDVTTTSTEDTVTTTTEKATTTTAEETTSSTTSSSSSSCSTSTSTSSSSSSSSSSSCSSTASSTSTAPAITTTAPVITTTTKLTTTRTTSSALCTTTITPPAQCEYKCGNWCAPSLPDWDDQDNCLDAWKQCAKQVTSCWKYAGFPAALKCLEFSQWCSNIKDFCQSDCKRKGKGCGKSQCFTKNKPQHPNPPKPPTPTTSVFPCPPATTVTTAVVTSTTSCAPEPTNICKQPTSSKDNYGPGNPVGGIELPLVTCNDIKQDFFSKPFKLYTEQDSRRCKSYPRNQCSNACVDACQEQYEECKETYVESCKSSGGRWKRGEENQLERRTFFGGNFLQGLLDFFNKPSYPPSNPSPAVPPKDSPSRGLERCTSQYKSCLAENKYVNPNDRCRNWGYGL